MHDTDDTNTFLTPDQLSVRYGLARSTIDKWRQRNQGPIFYKRSRLATRLKESLIRYKLADVLAWEQTNNITPLN